MLYLLNADRGGADSVAHLIAAGKIVHLPCPSYPEYQEHMRSLIAKPTGEDDTIVLDTLDRMGETTRGDIKLGPGADTDIWAARKKLIGEDDFGASYSAAATSIMRWLRNANNRGYRIITVCHENEQFDREAGFKKRAPQLNPKFYDSLIGSCTDCFRLTVLREDRLDGEGRVVARAGTRVIQTTMDDDAICKYQVTPDEEGSYPVIPKFIPNPTMRRIWKVLKKKPSWLTIYGESGSGKTTLACSEVYPEPAPKKETK